MTMSTMFGRGGSAATAEAARAGISSRPGRRIPRDIGMTSKSFDLDDLRRQITELKRSGSIDADGEVQRIQGIIDSMTPAERRDPHLIDIPRRRRIAAGAGVDPSDVSGLVKQFDGMAAAVKQFTRRL